MSQRYEDAVLKGTALVLLDLPPALRSAVQPLRILFDTQFPGNCITHILLNPSPISSNSGEGVMECGAVFFETPAAMWNVLDRVRVLLRTEDGALELRRGHLTLGVQEILVEGVVTWGAGGRERPSSSTEKSDTPAPPTRTAGADKEVRSVSNGNRTGDATASPSNTATASARSSLSAVIARAPHSSRPNGREQNSAETAQTVKPPQTVVVALNFYEKYYRNRDVRQERERISRGEPIVNFPLSVFMIYQMLISECQPRKIVLISSREDVARRMTRALVELESAAVAEHVIRVFARRSVEFVSESAEYKTSGNGSKAAEKAPPPICPEVRYFVNCLLSVRNGENRYLADGRPNYHRTINARRFHMHELDLTDPDQLVKLQRKAPREWQPDPHASRLPPAGASVAPTRSAPSMGNNEKSAPVPTKANTAERRRRTRSPSRSPSRRRRRSSSYSGSRSSSYSRSRTASRSRSRSTSPSSSVASSRRRHHPRDRRHRERGRRHATGTEDSRAFRSGKTTQHHRAETSHGGSVEKTHEATSTAAVERATPMVEAPPQAHALPVTPAPIQLVTTMVPPSVAYDSEGPLPVGWRPIFSQEYQQTYYAHRDARTGVETTTWERPSF